jgi:hypothetical protein
MYILRTVDGLASIVAVQSGEPTNLKPLDKSLLYWTVDIAAGHFNDHDKGGIEVQIYQTRRIPEVGNMSRFSRAWIPRFET